MTVTGLSDALSFLFTGREADGVGLYYFRARYYDPVLARFISEDPLGLLGGLNLYTYGAGSPLNLIDPLGLAAAGSANYQLICDFVGSTTRMPRRREGGGA